MKTNTMNFWSCWIAFLKLLKNGRKPTKKRNEIYTMIENYKDRLTDLEKAVEGAIAEIRESYESTTAIIKSISKYDELMQQARKELESYLKKYAQLAELEPIRAVAITFLQAVNKI